LKTAKFHQTVIFGEFGKRERGSWSNAFNPLLYSKKRYPTPDTIEEKVKPAPNGFDPSLETVKLPLVWRSRFCWGHLVQKFTRSKYNPETLETGYPIA